MAEPLITVDQVKKAADLFVEQNSNRFPLGISVEVLDTFISGRGFLLLRERPPRSLRALIVREFGIGLLHIAKLIDSACRGPHD